MLSPTEAAARNAQVKLRELNNRADAIENAVELAIKRADHAKKRAKSPLPTIEPSKRSWNRPPHVAKVRTSGKVRIPISTPSPVVRDTQVNGITSFHQVKRVPQYAIDVVKVARYLAK